jgi:hypothetical protein
VWFEGVQGMGGSGFNDGEATLFGGTRNSEGLLSISRQGYRRRLSIKLTPRRRWDGGKLHVQCIACRRWKSHGYP